MSWWNSQATLTGSAKNSASKGAATKIAHNCGAKTVTNNIIVEAAAKTRGQKAATRPTKQP